MCEKKKRHHPRKIEVCVIGEKDIAAIEICDAGGFNSHGIVAVGELTSLASSEEVVPIHASTPGIPDIGSEGVGEQRVW